MADPSYLRRQADIFDRVADQCSVPELVPYYRKLAQDYRARSECPADESPEAGCERRASR
jgi:hypothetical protein